MVCAPLSSEIALHGIIVSHRIRSASSTCGLLPLLSPTRQASNMTSVFVNSEHRQGEDWCTISKYIIIFLLCNGTSRLKNQAWNIGANGLSPINCSMPCTQLAIYHHNNIFLVNAPWVPSESQTISWPLREIFSRSGSARTLCSRPTLTQAIRDACHCTS